MKIFIATGTQLAFDRLVKAVDDWATEHPEAEIFAQIGPSSYRPQRMESQAFMAPQTFERRSKEADVIIAHAGTGTIFTALELRTPIIVMPRLHKHGEHRNDHQVATVERFKKISGVNVAFDEHELRAMLDDIDGLSRPDAALDPHARPELLGALSAYINGAPRMRKRDRIAKLFRALRP
jgi:UDP-N-acetylglucosamine transferase subunit ALG13